MRNRTKIIIGLAALCAGTLIFGACSSNNSPYRDYAKEGYNFSVCYDANGGKAAGKNNSSIVDTYPYERVKEGVKLYAPNDTARGTGNFYNVERNGYFLAGWYAKRTPRVDENGNPLDEEGNICDVATDVLDASGNPVEDEDGNPQKVYYSKYGKPQGYTYSEKWDFNSLLKRDDFVYEEDGGYAFTLYAAWVPEFSYELQGQEQEWICESCGAAYHQPVKPDRCIATVEAEGENGQTEEKTCGGTQFSDNGKVWYSVSSYQYNPQYSTEEDGSLTIPEWNDESGALDYGKFSRPSDKTFVSVYATEEDFKSETGALQHLENKGTWDEATATATGNVVRFYAKWEEGVWYHIKTKEQLAENAGGGRSYELLADLEYTEEDEWPSNFSTGSFTGTFRGNNHTISGVTVHQKNSQDTRGGLFGTIAASAVFENITFENVTYHLEAASRRPDSMFGLFAGELSNEATMTKVSVSGKLHIADTIYVDSGYNPDTGLSFARYNYDIGLLSGNFATCGISLEKITLALDNVVATVVDKNTGEIKIG